jgi:EAL domain-containing protein (putative c-di-GMP-specific phosphodiesterase class I)
MYEAKGGLGGRSSVFDPGAGGRGRRLMAVEHGLRDAISRGELALHYQPVVALQDPRAIGAEGLLRWTSHELGDVGPDEFIDVAERSGLIDQLGTWVLDRALRDLAQWRRSGVVDESFRVAVNVSAHQLTEALPTQVEALLARHRVPPRNLGLEITESAVMTGETPAAVLDRLHALGVTLLLDDFGTGYSSLSHLRRYPFDVVKVDRSFTAGLCARGEDHALVVGILSLAHALGKTVVAEGIETSRQLHELHVAGCDKAQGFWLSGPVPAEQLEAALGAAGDASSNGSRPEAAA